MVDTVHIWLSFGEVGREVLLDTIQSPGTFTEKKYPNGAITLIGNIQNMVIYISENGVSIKGSLAKFWFGNNFEVLTRKEVGLALEKLCESLNLDLGRGRLSRIDFGHNMIVKYPPSTYYPYLGLAQYFERLQQPDSISYQNSFRSFIVYDKIKQAKSSRETIPPFFRGKHVLRIEARFLKQPHKSLKIKYLFASDLNSEWLFESLNAHWLKIYQSIMKNYPIRFDESKIKRPKDGDKQLIAMGIQYMGGLSKVLEMINELKKMDVMNSPEYYSRFRNKVRKIEQEATKDTDNELIRELDTKVAELGGVKDME